MNDSQADRPPWFFSLADESSGIRRELADGINTRIFVGDNAMLSVVRLEPNARGKIHSHSQEQWGVLLEGTCTRIQDDEEVHMEAGSFWRTPGGVPHGIVAGPEGAIVLDVFSPPREEYKSPGQGFGSD